MTDIKEANSGDLDLIKEAVVASSYSDMRISAISRPLVDLVEMFINEDVYKVLYIEENESVAFAVLKIISKVNSEVEILFIYGPRGLKMGKKLFDYIRATWKSVFANLMRGEVGGVPAWRDDLVREWGATTGHYPQYCQTNERSYDVVFNGEV